MVHSVFSSLYGFRKKIILSKPVTQRSNYSVKKEVGNFFSAPSQNLSRRFRELARIIQEKSAKIRVIRGKKSLGKRSQTSKNFLYGVLIRI